MLLNGTSSRAATSGLGGVSGSANQAITIAALIRRNSTGGWDNIWSGLSSGSTVIDLTIDNTDHLQVEIGAGIADTVTIGTGHWYVAADKLSGSGSGSPVSFHTQKYGTDATVQHRHPTGFAGSSAFTTLGVGSFNTSADWFDGDIYAVAIWNRQLADWEHEWLAADLTAWHMLNPDWLVIEHASGSLPSNIPDLSANGGAPLTTLTSLAVSSASMLVGYGAPELLATRQPSAAGGGDTATMGVAVGSGISPTARADASPGVAITASTSPTAAAQATAGVATTTSVAPGATVAATPNVGVAVTTSAGPSASAQASAGISTSTGTPPGVTVPVGPGVAAGVGISPSDGSSSGDTTTLGVATGIGIAPSSATSLSATRGTANAATTSPTVATTVAPGTAAGTSQAPTTRTTLTPTVGVAAGVGISPFAASLVVATVAQGVAITPTSRASTTPLVGVATGIGISPSQPAAARWDLDPDGLRWTPGSGTRWSLNPSSDRWD